LSHISVKYGFVGVNYIVWKI